MRAACLLLLLAVIIAGAAAYSYDYCGAPVPQAQQVVANANLIQVTLITRHGDRAPANVMPNENITWTCGTSDVLSLVAPSLASGT
jgi:hypothetical protein